MISPNNSGSRTMASPRVGTGILAENWRTLEMQVANALVRRDALQTPIGRMCQRCPTCWCKRMHVVSWYIFLGGFGIMCISLLIAFGVGIVVPYKQASGFLPTTCTNVETLYNAENKIHCSCGSGRASCNSYYPCLKIFVKFTRRDGMQVKKTMLQASQFSGPCTVTPPCSAYEWVNKIKVRTYKHDFGMLGQSFPCLYNPKKGSTEVIQKIYGSELQNMHLLAWPAAFTILFIGLGFVVYSTCGCEYICRRYPPEDVKNGADQLLNMGINDLEKLNPEESESLLKQCCPVPEPTLS